MHFPFDFFLTLLWYLLDVSMGWGMVQCFLLYHSTRCIDYGDMIVSV